MNDVLIYFSILLRMDLRRLSFDFLVQDTVVISSHGFYSRLRDIFFILLSFLLCLENVKWGIIMKTDILKKCS